MGSLSLVRFVRGIAGSVLVFQDEKSKEKMIFSLMYYQLASTDVSFSKFYSVWRVWGGKNNSMGHCLTGKAVSWFELCFCTRLCLDGHLVLKWEMEC